MIEKLKTMISEHCYDELVEKLTEQLGENNAKVMLPAVAKALVEGGREERERILNTWLDMDSCRVCTTCGKIIEEGWYLNDAGYACSDECAAKSEGITMEQFKKWQIYKDDIIEYLRKNDDTRDIDELSEEECEKIIEEIVEDSEYYWTEWY